MRSTTRSMVLGCLFVASGMIGEARGDVTFFTTSSSFTTANPGLPTETFESARVTGTYSNVPSPLNSTTNDGVFQPGDLLPGFTLASTGPGGTGLAVTNTGTTPGGTKEVAVAAYTNAMDLTFGAGVSAVAANLIASPSPGVLGTGTFEVNVYSGTGLIGTTSVSVSGVNTFFGVDSTGAPITHVTISDAAHNLSILADNLTFGSANFPVFYSSRAAFVASHDGLPTETFESARLNGAAFLAVAGPISSTTNDGVFHPGDLLPGFSLATTGGTGNPFLVVTGTNTIPGATKNVGAQDPAAGLQISLGANVTAFGADLLASTGPGVASTETLDVSLFGASGLISTQTVNVSGASTFFGVDTKGTAITSVTISEHNANTHASVFVDNLTFNGAPVPEPSALVLTLVAIGPVAVLVGRARRRSRAA